MQTTIKAISLLAAAGVTVASPHVPFINRHTRHWDPTATSVSVLDTPTSTSVAAVSNTATATADVAAAAATAKTLSPTSNVEGKAFNRILQIYLETTAYENVINNSDCKALIDQGILLTNEYGVAGPSQPNYVAPASGDYYGTNSDSFLLVAKNVSTVVDLLEDKSISWGDYNEGLPYTGFDGFEYSNPVEGNYARKHNLLVRFQSVFENEDRLAKVKNLTMFYEDLNNKQLPQWGFVTPNLYNNGHDTNISVSCSWTRSFVEPLLKNTYFNDGKTLVYITWQANGQYPTERNHVAGILLGSAVDQQGLAGTRDDAYYNHYSEISSVEANWGLHTLGRWDVGANVWRLVGAKTGDAIRTWDEQVAGGGFGSFYWNQSYGGVFSSADTSLHVYPAPNLELVRNGRTVLPAIVDAWKRECGSFPSRNASGPWSGAHGWTRRAEDGPGCGGGPPHGEHQGVEAGEAQDDGTDRNDDGGNNDGDDSGDEEDGDSSNDDDSTSATDGQDGQGATTTPTSTSGGSHTEDDGSNPVPTTYCLPDYYRDIIEIPDAAHPPKGFEVPLPLDPPEPITTPITVYPVGQ